MGCDWFPDATYCTDVYDDDDFKALEMCCICGGGNEAEVT
jgi:hypothetical protein